jgi:hypothetical protein
MIEIKSPSVLDLMDGAISSAGDAIAPINGDGATGMRHVVANHWVSLATIAALAMFRTGLEHDSPLRSINSCGDRNSPHGTVTLASWICQSLVVLDR